MRDLIVKGMNGLGDCLHQRAVIRQLMQRHRVWLKTPWPSVYHDLVGDNLLLLPPETKLRTQVKNAQRQRSLYTRRRPGYGQPQELVICYPPGLVRATGSVLGGMMSMTKTEPREADFRLPVPQAWRDEAAPWIARWNPTKPLLIYRPLVERVEWGGCPARNPDHTAYAELIESIADRYFVVSIADLEPGKEWLACQPRTVPGMTSMALTSDVELHAGELSFEAIAGLMSMSSLVFTSPGFALVLAQSIGTPVVGVFGGYEDACSFSAGAHYAPFLPIEPITPCNCFAHGHACDKRIDLPAALARLSDFANEFADRQPLAA